MLAAVLLASSVAGTTVFRIDTARSEAGFDLKATMHTVHGTTTGVTGDVRVSGAPGEVRMLSGRIEIDAAALGTGNSGRDKTLHGTTLAVDLFPHIVFTPERFAPAGAADAGGAVSGALSGSLTIRDVTKPIAIAAVLREDPERLVVEGTFEVPWPEFGLPDPSFLFVKVARVAHAHFRAELARVED